MRPRRSALSEALRAKGREMGFALVGVATPAPSDHMEFYRSWLAEGRHGEMGYLSRADSVARRADLTKTMASAGSVILVADEYFQADPSGVPEDPSRAVVSRYARGADYHDVLKGKLESLLAWLGGEIEGGASGRVYVDTGPILERELARRAGLGWFGKNTMLINPLRGSYFFIGLILVDVDLRPDVPFVEDRCGTCRACLDACPTNALLGRDGNGAPVIDARRCISYLTIELRSAIPRDLRRPMGNRVFGCDICQEVCPWNDTFARPTTEPAYEARGGLNGVKLLDLVEQLLESDDDGFRARYRDSPIARPGRTGMLRNLCVALGNWGDARAVPILTKAVSDPSPLVRSHAAWALGEVGTFEAVAALRNRLSIEAHGPVLEEIRSALDTPGSRRCSGSA